MSTHLNAAQLLFCRHLKLELLTQFSALNDDKCMKNRHMLFQAWWFDSQNIYYKLNYKYRWHFILLGNYLKSYIYGLSSTRVDGSKAIRVNHFNPEFTIFIHCNPGIAIAILGWQRLKVTWSVDEFKKLQYNVKQSHENSCSRTFRFWKLNNFTGMQTWCFEAPWELRS